MSQDGFGTRTLSLDPETGDATEVLALTATLARVPEFAAATGERVARLARVRHTLYARVRTIERPTKDRLLLISDHVPGWRLSEVLTHVEREQWRLDIGTVIGLLRQLIPAVALFSRHQRDASIGTIGPERLILTPQGHLVIAEYVLAPGLEKLQYSRDRLWREFRVATPPTASPSKIPPSADIVGIGVVALSLLLGRLLKEDEFLVSLGDLFDSLTETVGGATRPLSATLDTWMTRALQFETQSSFETTQEAQVAFEEVLARERSYVTSAVQLNHFVVDYERLAGPPPIPTAVIAPVAPVPPAAPVRPAAPVSPVSPAAPASPVPPEPLPWRKYAPWILAAVAVVEALAIFGLISARGPALIDRGELVIQSWPIGASVTIDRQQRGITPYETDLSAGPHVIEVQVGRSEPRVITVMISPGVRNEFYVELQNVATVGGLEVRTDPPKAKVTISGQDRGLTPLVLGDLPPGEVEVVVRLGAREVRQMVRIEPGMTSQLVIPLGR